MYSDRIIGINVERQPRFKIKLPQPCDCASLCFACRELGIDLRGLVPRAGLRTSEEYFVEQLVGHGRIFVPEEEGFLVVLAFDSAATGQEASSARCLLETTSRDHHAHQRQARCQSEVKTQLMPLTPQKRTLFAHAAST